MPETTNPGVRAGKRRSVLRTPQARFEVIRPLIMLLAAQVEGGTTIFVTHTGRELSTLTSLVRYRARLVDYSERSIWRWLALFRKAGLNGLRNRPRHDAGVPRRLSPSKVRQSKAVA